MSKELNCPNCGAPITGEKCGYCGTLFVNFSIKDNVFNLDEPINTLRFRHGGKDYKIKCYVVDWSIEHNIIYSDSLERNCEGKLIFPPKKTAKREITIKFVEV